MAKAKALKADSDLHKPVSQTPEVLLTPSPVVIILPTEDINVEGNASRYRERVEDMRDHLRREIANFLSLETKVGEAVRPRAYVDDCA